MKINKKIYYESQHLSSEQDEEQRKITQNAVFTLKKKKSLVNLLETLDPSRKLYICIKHKVGIKFPEFMGFLKPHRFSSLVVREHPGGQSFIQRAAENTHVVQRDGLHHLVLLRGIHFIQVTISDKNCSVFHLTKSINL